MRTLRNVIQSEIKRLTLATLLMLGFLALGSFPALALQSVTLAWDPSPDPTVVGYNVYYGGASGNYTNKLDAGSATSVMISNLVEGATYYFTVTAYDSSGLESAPSNEVTYTVPLSPVVSLTSPANGAGYLAPATLSLVANVVTNGHTITQVQFFNGTTLLGSAAIPPYAFSWSGVSAGSYTLLARVFYDASNTVDSAPANITVTNPPPAIALTAPAGGATYTAPATVSLAANVTTNGHTITQVQFYNGSTLLGIDTQPPYAFTWSSVNAGSYTVKARLVYDSGSTLDSTSATITITNPPPAIALTAPASGASYLAPATVSLAANVTTNGHTITQVQFYNGSTLLGSDAQPPYAFTWNNVSAGSYTVKARLVYDSGSTLDSPAASITVTNGPPSIALTSPANGAGYAAPATVTLSANVSTNGHTITQVQFYNGSTLLGSDTQPPYAFTWSSVSAGSYTVKARLVYDSGSTLDSLTASLTVTNPAPAVALTAPVPGTSYLAPATVSMSASVTTNGHTITQVQFYNGSTLLGGATVPPYLFTWSGVNAGAYNLKARVVYDSGSTVDSAATSISVTNPAPTIALTTPASGDTFASPATVNLAVNITANGNTTTKVQFYNGGSLLGESTASPYSFTWNYVAAGSYSLTARLVYNGSSTVDSAAATIAVTNGPPVIVLLTPTNGAAFSAPIDIFCTANVLTNGHSITKVQFYSDTNLLGETATAPFSLDWYCTNSGIYNVSARLVYDSGSTLDTAPATIQVKPAPPGNPRIITVDGSGTVTPNLSTQPLVIGKSYTVTAVPDGGQQFAGWSGSISSSSPRVTFTMTPGFHLQAHFIPFPNGGVQSSYYGLFYESSQVQQGSSGSFVLATTKRGLYSGYLQLGKSRLPFHGQLSAQGQGANTLLCPDHSTLALQFSLLNGSPADQVQGTVTATNWVASLLGDRAVFNPVSNPAPLQGAFTMIIPGPSATDPAQPFGHSFGIASIDSGGHIRLAASLADGTRLTQSAPLSARGHWGLYAPLYAGQGSLVSWLAFTNRPTDDFNGPLSWIKPANSKSLYYPGGFTNDCQALGSAFIPPVLLNVLNTSDRKATVSFAGGALTDTFTNAVAETGFSQIYDLSPNKLTMSVSPTTGAFRGSVTDPTSGQTLPFAGVLFQKTTTGYGFLLDLGQSSQVEVGH